MSRLSTVGEFIGTTVGLVIGWLFSIIVLVAVFYIGRWAAPHLLEWNDSQDILGLLSVIAFVWMVERRNLEDKYDRLREIIDRDVIDRLNRD